MQGTAQRLARPATPLAKIGPVDVEIIGWKGIVIRNGSKTYSLPGLLSAESVATK